jgi:hypothetical protein
MSLPPKRDHTIPIANAVALTRRYREQAGANAQRSGLFFSDAVQKLLAQAGCEAMRVYYGCEEGGEPTLVLVGVAADGHDMTDGEVLDVIVPCPPNCQPPNGANSLDH